MALFHSEYLALTGLLLATVWNAAAVDTPEKLDLQAQRMVFLGDSITDGFSYPLLAKQALEEAGIPAGTFICAGIGGDTAAQMEKRLERDVFVHKPTLVTLSAGINDVLRKVAPTDCEKSINNIAAQLKANSIPLLVLTTSVLGPKQADADKQLAAFNAALRAIAKREGCRLADVNELMNKARANGTEVIEEDHVHPNYEGHRIMARAVLDAMGYANIVLPKELKVSMLPGVVREWKLSPAPVKSKPLDEAAVAALKPDATWISYSLPEKEPNPVWWLDQERRRGVAVSFEKSVGKANVYYGIAAIEAAQAKHAYVNTGAHVRAVWLNGRLIHITGDVWTGWHPGRDRIPVDLVAGKNVLVIETGNAFFVSVTDNNDW